MTRVPGPEAPRHRSQRQGPHRRESYRAGTWAPARRDPRARPLLARLLLRLDILRRQGAALRRGGRGGGQNYTVYLRRFNGAPAVRSARQRHRALARPEVGARACPSRTRSDHPLRPAPATPADPLEGVSPSRPPAWFPTASRLVVPRGRAARARLYVQSIDGREASPHQSRGVGRTARDRRVAGRQVGRGPRPGSQGGAVSAADGPRARGGAAEDEFPCASGTTESRSTCGSAASCRRRSCVDLETGGESLEGAHAARPGRRRANLERRRRARGHALRLRRSRPSDLFVVEGLK